MVETFKRFNRWSSTSEGMSSRTIRLFTRFEFKRSRVGAALRKV